MEEVYRATVEPKMEVILTAVDDDLANAWTRFCGDLPGLRVYRGSILELKCDAAVSPANSFGFMDGGIDALYKQHFVAGLENRLRDVIRRRHHGELLVGAAEILETGHSEIPYLIATPTIRVPMLLRDSVNPYLAAQAVFLLIKHRQFESGERQGQPISDTIKSVAFPGLGTGVGGVGPNTCANQLRAAIEDIVLGKHEGPRSWAEASERHQLLYTDRPGRLQR
jgi:O-acetyl-ADP-ribose deacetylase (regulator of RNase III)